MSDCVHWFMGRGASIACGLGWDIPPSWQSLPREDRIERIKKTLRAEMYAPTVSLGVYEDLLSQLANRTRAEWCHKFYTTNWDLLVERAFDGLRLQVHPSWLHHDCFVYHMNGTIEEPRPDSKRSPFLLPDDPFHHRKPALEANMAWGSIVWGGVYVLVGMSLECQVDRFLFYMLNRIQDEVPVGSSPWILVNPDSEALAKAAGLVSAALPRATLQTVEQTLDAWVQEGMPELTQRGILSEHTEADHPEG
jgi:hypothetical protein